MSSRVVSRTVVDYHRDLRITNLDQLPRGLGCRFLLCLDSIYDEPKEYIAKRWLRKMPATTSRGEVVIRM